MSQKSYSLHSDKICIGEEQIDLYSQEGFDLLSELWLKVGWNQRYHYTFKWMGLPVLQLPDDLLRLQEVIFEVKPDVIIETGIALGGSLLFYASLCKTLGHGRVIGIDIDLRECNRKKLEEHALAPYLTLIDGDSADPKIASKLGVEGKKVLVVLDANHSKNHVAKELENFAPLVSVGSYLIVCDGFKEKLVSVPRGKEHWKEDNPLEAVRQFLCHHPEFVLERDFSVSHLTNGWLKKRC